MASNSFGTIFKMTTWGESHGQAIGVVIDGCPAGLDINEDEVNSALAWRAPGRNPYTSPRKEEDKAQILSGVFEGKTTGAPISILIYNKDADSSAYEPIKNVLRPGHANYTYLQKYGIFDYRGGGRSSARETACRVAAGAIAKKLLSKYDVHVTAYIKQISTAEAAVNLEDFDALQAATYASLLFCPDIEATALMIDLLEKAKSSGDSLGGIVEFMTTPLPVGLGDPIYEKLEARLAYAMMSLPATKGFEIGSGFHSIFMQGSTHNDPFVSSEGTIKTKTNHAGGTLGGISTGMPLIGRVAFKPTSSIAKPQMTVTTSGEATPLQMPQNARHDPCIAIRAVPIVEAMIALVLADAILVNRSAKLS